METEKTDTPDTESKGMEAQLPKEDKNIASWQFKYSKYRAILPHVDEAAGSTLSGKPQRAVIKARNYRRDLDLRIPEEKAMHEALMKDSRLDLDFWLLTGAKKKQKATEKGANLEKLLAMPEPQIRGILSADQLRAVGLDPNAATRHELAMAIITSYNKTMVRGPEEETKK